MSGDFTYVWDAELHGVPETLEQANDLYNKFRQLAREEESEDLVQTPTLNSYGGELYDYYVEHELDLRHQPLIEDCCKGVIIIEDGLTFGSAQYYHAVQQAVKQGLGFFEVDANIVFLPDGRVLPEEEQAAWQALGRKIDEDAKKPRDQVFPTSEKALTVQLNYVMEQFIRRHEFNLLSQESFSISKESTHGIIRSQFSGLVNSIGLSLKSNFSMNNYSSKDVLYKKNFYVKNNLYFSVEVSHFLYLELKKTFNNIRYNVGNHSISVLNHDLEVLKSIFHYFPDFYEKLYHYCSDLRWLNQLINHHVLLGAEVSASSGLKLILAAVNNDPCFDKIIEDGRKKMISSFLKDKINPCPDEATAEQKYAEYVEYVRNMKTVPWQLEEIPPEYQVKRPEGLLLVHELDVKLKENEAYSTSFLLASNDPMQVILKFITTDGGEAGVSVKGAPDGVNITFENWAYVSEFELPQPQVLGKTDDGRDFCMSYQIKTSHQLNSHRHINSEGQALGVSSLTIMSTTYQLLWQMFVAR